MSFFSFFHFDKRFETYHIETVYMILKDIFTLLSQKLTLLILFLIYENLRIMIASSNIYFDNIYFLIIFVF
jgi:hypothetical protein